MLPNGLRLLADPGGRKVAVIVNEFGEIGIDGRRLAGAEPPFPSRHVSSLRWPLWLAGFRHFRHVYARSVWLCLPRAACPLGLV